MAPESPNPNPNRRFEVLGHWRRLPNGKRVWIPPRIKGPDERGPKPVTDPKPKDAA